jgi:DNA-binding NarL/FixJ family response regulator
LIRAGILATGMTLRIGLREVLRSLPEVEVAAEAERPQGLPPLDVLVVASPELLADLEEGPPPVLLLTNEPEEAHRLTDFPVWGILPLEASPEELSAALHALAEGLWAGSPALTRDLLVPRSAAVLGRAAMMDGAEEVADRLTERERQVLQLAAEGLANKQIASRLEISENTVKFHLSSLYAKLGATSRTEAVRAGARRGWVVL